MSRYRYALVIFDLDGTLIDSKRDIMSSVNATLKSLRLPERPDSELLQYVGSGIEPLLAKATAGNNGCDLNSALDLFRNHYLKNLLVTTRPYPGVIEGLTAISSINLSILTNKSYLFSDKIITGLGMDHFFDFLYGGDSLPYKKPDPGAIHKIMGTLSPRSVLMVGDSPVDIEAGRRAGVDTCGVSYGYKAPASLIQAGADYLKDTFSEVINLIVEGE